MTYGAINIDPSINNGQPVIVDTNISVQVFIEYLEEGKSIEKFLDDFPEVNKKDIIEVLQMAKLVITNEKILKENFSGQ